jgi:hypothetical protein
MTYAHLINFVGGVGKKHNLFWLDWERRVLCGASIWSLDPAIWFQPNAIINHNAKCGTNATLLPTIESPANKFNNRSRLTRRNFIPH